MFDYEVECPKCGAEYIKDIDNDNDEYKMCCEDCGCNFSVFAEVTIDVIITEVADKIKEMYGEEYEDLKCGNIILSFTARESSLRIPFTYRKRNPKTNEYYQKKYEIPVTASFCPFCGKSTKEEEKEKTDENS